jgi:formate dehydrogenase iron-sulfur subunit
VTVDLVADRGRITAFAQEVRACALGRASAAVLGAQVIGRSRAEIAAARDQLRAMLTAERLTFARCGIVDPLSLDDYRAHGGWQGLERALALPPAEIVEEVVRSGLRGRGGAGFPTGIKWRTVLQTESPQKYVVCNADEGDSGTFADRMIMEGDPFVLIDGMTIAGIATGATKGYVYIRSEYPHAIVAMSAAIAAARRQGWLGKAVAGLLLRVRPRGADQRRRLRLRRGDGAAR